MHQFSPKFASLSLLAYSCNFHETLIRKYKADTSFLSYIVDFLSVWIWTAFTGSVIQWNLLGESLLCFGAILQNSAYYAP